MELLQEIGAYAGLASIVGLAVLSALYFSQARDLRRLREWAGRAPERAAESRPVQPPAAAPVPKPAQVASQTVEQTAVVAVPAGAPAEADAEAGPQTDEAPPAAANGKDGNGQPAPPSVPRTPPRAPAGARPPLAAPPLVRSNGAPQHDPGPPWYRRVAGRYVALAVAGLLIVGGAVAYAVGALDGLAPSGDGATAQQGSAGGASARRGGGIQPTEVTFSVLNGTQTEGLAKQIADKLEADGFRRGNVTNATQQQKAESVVLYARGHRREASMVARRLDISQLEPIDPASQSLAGDATVVIIVGADQTS